MTAVLLGVAVGYLGARLLWMVLVPLFQSPLLVRANYRGHALPTSAGIVLPLVAGGVEGARAVAGSFGIGDGVGLSGGRALVLMAVGGFGLLGFIDDLFGSPDDRGFRGHIVALRYGRLTTGAMKLLGGAALAVVVVAPEVGQSPGRLAVDSLLVALSANAVNLLDRAPGRATKVGTTAFASIVLATWGAVGLAAVAVVVGGALGLLPGELHERLMLGDAGANALGAVVGLGLVMSCGVGARDVALVVVVLLNVAGEVVSLGRMIESTPLLRSLDRAGRPPTHRRP